MSIEHTGIGCNAVSSCQQEDVSRHHFIGRYGDTLTLAQNIGCRSADSLQCFSHPIGLLLLPNADGDVCQQRYADDDEISNSSCKEREGGSARVHGGERRVDLFEESQQQFIALRPCHCYVCTLGCLLIREAVLRGMHEVKYFFHAASSPTLRMRIGQVDAACSLSFPSQLSQPSIGQRDE